MSRKPPAVRKAGGLQTRSGESLVPADLEILLNKGRNLGASHKFKRLIDNQFRKDGAPKFFVVRC